MCLSYSGFQRKEDLDKLKVTSLPRNNANVKSSATQTTFHGRDLRSELNSLSPSVRCTAQYDKNAHKDTPSPVCVFSSVDTTHNNSYKPFPRLRHHSEVTEISVSVYLTVDSSCVSNKTYMYIRHKLLVKLI